MERKDCKRIFIATLLLVITSKGCCVSLLNNTEYHAVSVNFKFNSTMFNSVLQEMDFLSLHLRHINEGYNNVVQFLLKNHFCTIQLTVGASSSFTEKQRHRAITVTSEQELGIVLSRHSTRAGKMMCLLFGAIGQNRLLELARDLWLRKGVYKVYYVGTERTLFYNPFALGTSSQYGALVNADNMNVEAVTNKLNGYPIRVYIFRSVYSSILVDRVRKQVKKALGADSTAATLLSQNMNFTMMLQLPDDEFFGTHLDNGSYSGAIGRTIRYETDVTMTGFFVKDYLTREVEFTFPVYMDELCCYVMKAERIPQSIAPLFAVKTDMWIGFLTAGVMGSFVWTVLRKVNLRIQGRGSNSEENADFRYARIFTDTWVVWVRVSLARFPVFNSERIFVTSMCLVSVIFGALFESSLATLYIHPRYYKDINTLKELDEANLKIYIKHAAMQDDLFYGHSSSVYKSLDRKLVLVREAHGRLIHKLIESGGFAAVTRSSSLSLEDFPFFISNKIHKINECPKKYHIAFLMPKHSPYARRVNNLLLRYLQAGLVNQWIELTQHEAKLSVYKSPTYSAEQIHIWKVLTLNDLQLAFYTLMLGSILALLTWIGEMLLRIKCSKRCR